MSKTSMEQTVQPNAEAWAKISQHWGAAGGESLAALDASLRKSGKANPAGRLEADHPARK